MNKVYSILTFIFMLVLSYLLGSFVAANFNIANWDGAGKLITGVVGTVMAIYLSIIVYIYSSKGD